MSGASNNTNIFSTGTNVMKKLNTLLSQLKSQQTSFGQTQPKFVSIDTVGISNSTIPITTDGVVTQLNSAMADVQQKQTAYTQAQTDYINALNGTGGYTQMPGQIYSQVSVIGAQQSVKPVANLNACQALCDSYDNCTGATYNSSGSTSTCALVDGMGILQPTTNKNSYSLIKTQVVALINLQNANQALINSLNTANSIISSNPKLLQDYGDLLSKTNNGINTSYKALFQQRDQIKDVLKNYISLNRDTHDSEIGIQRSQMIYRLFLVILGLLIFVLCIIKFNIKLTSISLVTLGLVLSFIVYILGMLTISAMIALAVVLYVILR